MCSSRRCVGAYGRMGGGGVVSFMEVLVGMRVGSGLSYRVTVLIAVVGLLGDFSSQAREKQEGSFVVGAVACVFCLL